MQQSTEELRNHLVEQVSFLRLSAEAFDRGVFAESKRLAHCLRVLLHHTTRSHALLEQLGVLSRMEFFDSGGEIEPINMISSCTLTMVVVTAGEGATYRAPLDESAEVLAPIPLPEPYASRLAQKFEAEHGRPQLRGGQWQPFDLWWRVPVLRDDDDVHLSRADLVLAVANTDGGSHVDPDLREPYAKLTRSNSLGWTQTIAGQDYPMGNPVPAAVRQIAYEVQLSVEREFRDLE